MDDNIGAVQVTEDSKQIRNTIDWDNLEDSNVVKIVRERLTNSKYHPKRKEREEVWEDCYNHWKGKYTEEKVIQMRDTTQLAEEIVAEIFPLIFDDKKIAKVEPGERAVDDRMARKVESFFHYQFYQHKKRIKKKMRSFLDQFTQYGTAVAKFAYHKRVVHESQRTKFKFLGIEVKDTKRVTEQFPVFEVPDIFNVYPDMDATDPSQISYVVEIVTVRLSELLNAEEFYLRESVDKLFQMKQNGSLKKKSLEALKKLSNANDQQREQPSEYNTEENYQYDEYDPLIELWYYYEKNRVVVVGNGLVVLHNSESEYDKKEIPFVFVSNYLDHESIYGLSDVELIMKMQEYKDSMLQRIYDMVYTAGKNKLLAPEEAEIDHEELMDKHNRLVRYRDMPDAKQKIFPLTIPTPNYAPAMDMVGHFDAKMISTVKGQQKQGIPRVAADVYKTEEARNKVFLMKLHALETFIMDCFDWYKALNIQFMPEKQQFKDKNAKGEKIWSEMTPEELSYRFEVSFRGIKNASDRDIMFMRMMNLYNILINREDINQDYMLELLVRFAGIENVEKLINEYKKPEDQNRMQAMLRQAAAQGGMGGQGKSGIGSSPGPALGVPGEEARRRDVSTAFNPNNSSNGGINGL
jgi:hypothetical protein